MNKKDITSNSRENNTDNYFDFLNKERKDYTYNDWMMALRSMASMRNVLLCKEYSEEALLAYPKDKDVITIAILTHLATGEKDKAISYMSHNLGADQKKVVTIKIVLSIYDNKYDEATKLLNLAVDEKWFELHELIGFIYEYLIYLKLDIDALMSLCQFIETHATEQKDSATLLDIALLYFDLDKLENTFSVLNRAIDIEPYNSEYWTQLANCYLAVEDFENCEKSCNFGIAATQEFSYMLYYLRACARFNKANYVGAIEDGELAVQYIKEHIDEVINKKVSIYENLEFKRSVFTLLADSYEKNNQIEKSIKVLSWLDENFCPQDPEIMSKLEMLYCSIGNIPRALEINDRSLELDPQNRTSLSHRVEMLIETEQFNEELESTLAELIKIQHRDPRLLLKLASVKILLNKDEEADEIYNTLVTIPTIHQDVIDMVDSYFEARGEEHKLVKYHEINQDMAENKIDVKGIHTMDDFIFSLFGNIENPNASDIENENHRLDVMAQLLSSQFRQEEDENGDNEENDDDENSDLNSSKDKNNK